MNEMNKNELIDDVAADANLSKKDAGKALDAILSNIGKSLSKKESVTLIGFGTFSVSERSARTGRNPQTGAEINIPAKNVVKFKPGKALKERV